MEKINLDLQKEFEIELWLTKISNRKYKYFFDEKDRTDYLDFLSSLNLKEDNTEEFKKYFKKIFLKNNLNVYINSEDIFWLFNFFNSIFL